MKGNMLAFASLWLLFCWMLPVDSMRRRSTSPPQDANPVIPLSMVEDSVDDMYFGCDKEMMNLVKEKYLKQDKMRSSAFGREWEKAKKHIKKQKAKDILTEEHRRAIYVYTSDTLYKMFNDAVRTERSRYTSSFKFHSLHFLLTSAIQILNNNKNCSTAYRKNNVIFKGRVNQTIRFGFFASSSLSKSLKDFGEETCFEIKTCLGALVEKYSKFSDEKEVLIPPYEMFKITQVTTGKEKGEGLNKCKVVIVLESAGGKSNLNCKLVNQ